MISVIIPTLDAGASLEATLASLARGPDLVTEIVVSDGGSKDDTCERAARAGCRVVVGERGRGAQLMRGAAQAGGEWLLFLHADTTLARGWGSAARAHIERAGSDRRAAAFRFALDDASFQARILERLVAARVRLLALPYGDQGLLISRQLYDELGGFRPLPIMEDVEFIRRIGRARLAVLAPKAITSAVRYRRHGYLRRAARNLACLTLYAAGLPPHTIAKLYG